MFIITVVSPVILDKIVDKVINWYSDRKNQGKIIIRTAQGTVLEVDAKNIKSLTLIEKKKKKRNKGKRKS